jgi:hypothetical protein
MPAYTLTSTVRRSCQRTLADVRDALGAQGLGVLTAVEQEN